MKTTTCQECHQPFEYEPFYIDEQERFAPVTCDPCKAVSAAAEVQRQETERIMKAADLWKEICPDEYQETDLSRLPRPYQVVIDRWLYGCKGIGFCGEAGRGKTRSAFSILRKQHFRGRRCYAISAKRFADLALDKFDHDGRTKATARDRIRKCHTADLLLIDDIGKGKLTDRPEEELYDLLEYRTSKRLPTLWTAESGGADLLQRLSAERGNAILRRLTQFSEIL